MRRRSSRERLGPGGTLIAHAEAIPRSSPSLELHAAVVTAVRGPGPGPSSCRDLARASRRRQPA